MSPGWLTVLEGNNGTGQTQWARAGPRSPAALAKGPCVGGLGESMPGSLAPMQGSVADRIDSHHRADLAAASIT